MFSIINILFIFAGFMIPEVRNAKSKSKMPMLTDNDK